MDKISPEQLQTYFPVWNKLTQKQQERLLLSAHVRNVEKGGLLLGGAENCLGMLLICSGRLRVYSLSESGKEVTLYRLSKGDMCLFSGSCAISNLRIDMMLEAETDTALWVIPASEYQSLMKESMDVLEYTNQLMAARFSDVMWLVEQILFKSMDSRLAAFLLDECKAGNGRILEITHEQIAHHLGTAREVVTRMLHYLQTEGMIELFRGGVKILDESRLTALAG